MDAPPAIQNEAWQDVLVAVDKTYAELVDYQERLEDQNHELNALKRFLSSVMASISDYLLVIDRSNTIQDAGQAVCEAMELSLEQMKKLDVSKLFQPLDSVALDTHLQYVMSARQTITIDAQIANAQGAEPVELRISPQLDRRRKVIGAVLTARPLGELRRAFAELEQSHDDLKQAQVQLVRNEKLASLGRLLAGVAHELNNPISFVYANTHAMDKYIDRFETYFDRVAAGAAREELIALRRDLKLDREMRNLRTALEGARDGAKRVRDLVEDLRTLSADGSGEFESFDLVEATRNAVNWIERGTRTNLMVRFDGADRALAYGRVGHIQQVLLNLIQNAADAIEEEDAPEIILDIHADDAQVALTIRDNGPGVAPDLVEQIFDPFFTTKDVGRGTGLGLSISHKIVKEHGGELRYRPRQARGACFQMILPSQKSA